MCFEPCIYTNVDRNMFVIVHVDDLLCCAERSDREEFSIYLSKKVTLNETHVLSVPGDALDYLGKRISMTARGYTVKTDTKLVDTLTFLFSMESCKGVATPGTVPSKTKDFQLVSPEEHHLYRRG